MERLSDDLLISIISFLPTRAAACTSLLSRRFRFLWEAVPSPSLQIIGPDLPPPIFHNFVAMADRLLLRRQPDLSRPLLRLHLHVPHHLQFDETVAVISSLLIKARTLGLRHLFLECDSTLQLTHVLPIIFSIDSLRSLSLNEFASDRLHAPEFESIVTNLTNLTKLSLEFSDIDATKFNRLLSKLCSLQDLHLRISIMEDLSLSSQKIRKFKLILVPKSLRFNIVNLSFPSLESFHLENDGSRCVLPCFQGQIPSLKEAVINLHEIRAQDVIDVARLLDYTSHAEELILHMKESSVEVNPIPILFKPERHRLHFPYLKHLDVTTCLHEFNYEAILVMLNRSPALESLKLVHEAPEFTWSKRGRKRRYWGSRLPYNADGNNCYACFRNLHLGENRKEVMKFMSKKRTCKRQAHDRNYVI